MTKDDSRRIGEIADAYKAGERLGRIVGYSQGLMIGLNRVQETRRRMTILAIICAMTGFAIGFGVAGLMGS